MSTPPTVPDARPEQRRDGRYLRFRGPAAHESDLADSLNTLGIRLSDLGRSAEALTATGEAAELSPESAKIMDTRGQVYQVMGRHEDAVTDLTPGDRA